MTKKLYFLSIASGALLALSFPPIPLGFLAFIGFIPLLLFIEENVASGKKEPMMKYLYITFFIFHVGTNWWISSFQAETDPFLMASGFALDLVGPFFFIIPIYLYRHIRLRTNRNIGFAIFPFVWVLYEWTHSLGEFSYPWQAIGYSQVANLEWVQMADITGIWGISFLIVVVNVILIQLYFNYKENKESKNNKKTFALVTLLFLVLILPQIYGNYKTEEFSHQNQLKKSEKQINIAIIQAAINPWRKWNESSSSQIRKHINLTDSLLNLGKKIDLTVWSETTIMRMSKRINTDLKLGYVQDWANKKDISILSGFVHDYVYKENESRQSSARFNRRDSAWMESFNSAILVQPNEVSQVYHKAKLTPFAERIPYVDYVSFLADYIKWGVGISSWGLGSGAETLTMKLDDGDSLKIGNIICIESIYPEFCRDFTLDGAEILMIITNDAWYDGTPGPAQHYVIAQVRAIEVRRSIARCANTGISGFIAANGETIQMANHYQREAIVAELPAIKYSSFYLRHGDWLPWSAFALVFIIFIFTFVGKRNY